VSNELKVTYVIVALILALILQPLKRFFDRATNKLFYRDAYDSPELLNNLNRSLVTTIDLEEMLGKSTKIIGETIKTEYCTFAIKESENNALLLIGGPNSSITSDIVQQIANSARHLRHKVVVTDELGPDHQHLKDLMWSGRVSAFVKLQGVIKGHAQHPGYLLLGQKRSGGLFSDQDTRVLEIIADELVIAVQNALRFEEIRRFNITLQKKIEEATRELRRANSRLREIDRAKDEFISMASHQLRTPLTAVKGYLSMVLEGDTGPVKKNQKELIQRGFDGAQKMVYLIADMLNVSRLQTGKFVIENKPTKLADIVEGEVNQLQEQAASKQITLSFQKPADFPTLNLDETKVRQVIMNFLDNALYYTPTGGKVDAKLEATDDSVTFTVTDTGVGVPKAVQHHLFSKFYRAENAKKLRPDGTGLGLYMAKKVVIAQGGAIIFKSSEGQGSTFGFSFPKKSTKNSHTKLSFGQQGV
jgi:signal transduction histidine kinase